MQEVKLTIKTTQTIDKSQDTNIIETKGELKVKNEKILIKYYQKETDEKILLVVEKDCMTVNFYGKKKSTIYYKKYSHWKFDKVTPFGTFPVLIYTKDFKVEKEDNIPMHLSIDYNITMDEMEMGQINLDIKVEKQKA